MKTVRILNAFALLLIFAPFFQMCEDRESQPVSDPAMVSIDSIDVTASDTTTLESNLAKTTVSEEKSQSMVQKSDTEEPGFLEQLWEKMTFPGDYSTAFGLLLYSAVVVFDGNAGDIEVMTWLTILSILLTVVTLIRVVRHRYQKTLRLYLVNLVLAAGAFVAAIFTLAEFHQIKWGFYLYFGILLITTILFRKEIRSLE